MFVCVECGAMQPAAGFCPADGNVVAAIGEDLLLGTTIGAYRARLTRIDADGVYASGIADIVQVDGHLDLRFVSPSRTTRPKNVPRGVKVTGRDCEFRIMASSDGAEIYDMSDFNECKSVPIPRPRCSIKQVWAKVRGKHKAIDDAVAQITYMTNIVSHEIVWSFSIDDDPHISEMFADDC